MPGRPVEIRRPIETMLLLGLPASGKSVIRGRLAALRSMSREVGEAIGPMVQLDDFAWVHFMWQIDVALLDHGRDRWFFAAAGDSFADIRDWSTTLLVLLAEDLADLDRGDRAQPPHAGAWVVERIDRARRVSGLPALRATLAPRLFEAVTRSIADEAAPFVDEWSKRQRPAGSSVIVEFSRGGPAGSELPLEPPYGYALALSQLPVDVLRRAVIFHVDVSPAVSRQRNRARGGAGAAGTTLAHVVPETVMHDYYGVDDMSWLLANAERPGTVTVRAHARTFHVPAVSFDNRRVRGGGEGSRSDPAATTFDADLVAALMQLAGARRARNGTVPALGRGP